MKISTAKAQPAFTPIEVKIVVESQAEADAIHALFVTACAVAAIHTVFGFRLPYEQVAGLSPSDNVCGRFTDELRIQLRK